MKPLLLPLSLLLLAAALPLAAQDAAAPRELVLTPGKSVVLDSPVDIQRVSVANDKVAEAVGVTPREVLLNGREPGETTVIIWQQGGGRLIFDVVVRPKETPADRVRRELARELGEQKVDVAVEGQNVFLRGSVDDLQAAERAEAIASVLGKPVNLLNVKIPDGEAQILLKVRFADVERSVSSELGMNLFSTGATGTVGRVAPGGTIAPGVMGQLTPGLGADGLQLMLTDALNVFLFRPDLDLGATIRALAARNLVQILAEPNLLTSNGKTASFLAGGEFPYPVVQGGGIGFTPVTIQFREFGIRINFTPTITSRGTIRLAVAPEVSSLDYANGLVFQGFNVPAIAIRKVQTEVELEDRQSFAIAGLLDNRMTEALTKIPGLGDIPLLGKLFQSRQLRKNKQELLVIVTPEIVRPIPKDQPVPELSYPRPFLQEGGEKMPRTPGVEITGAAPAPGAGKYIPVERLKKEQAASPATAALTPVSYQIVPVTTQTTAPGTPAPAPAAPPPAVKPPAP
jgi:pilus assembly protein CpaC